MKGSINMGADRKSDYQRRYRCALYEMSDNFYASIWIRYCDGEEFSQDAWENLLSEEAGINKKLGRRGSRLSNSLAAKKPRLLKEWHPSKNINVNPFEVSYGSGESVWWCCENGHEFQAVINDRNNGNGCPFDAHKRPSIATSLASNKPELIQFWHPTKNGTLTPHKVLCNSRIQAWWICSNGHEYQDKICNKYRNPLHCKYCHSIAHTHPELVREWHPNRNGSLTIWDVQKGSHKKVWWVCENGHEYLFGIALKKAGKCKICNSLGFVNPKLSLEWHPKKNKNLKPFDVGPYSNKKVWWLCHRGHSWESTVNNRSNGNGCEKCCTILHTSFPEQVIFFYLKKVFKDAVNKFPFWKIRNSEFDIFIESIRLAIEYDGYFHINGVEKDERKNEEAYNEEILLIRIREPNLPNIQDNGAHFIYREDDKSDKSLLKCLKQLIKFIKDKFPEKRNDFDALSIDIERDRLLIMEMYQREIEKNSLAVYNPKAAEEWHPTLNGSLSPNSVHYGSDIKAWFRCENGHEYKKRVANRARGEGCRICRYQRQKKKHKHFEKIKVYMNCGKNVEEISIKLELKESTIIQYIYQINRINSGPRPRVTKKEQHRKIAFYIAQGKNVGEISRLIGIKTNTVIRYIYEMKESKAI